MLIADLGPTDRRLLALALDLLARRLRADGAPLPENLGRLREALATDCNRLEPTNRASDAEPVDAGPVLYDLDEVADRMRVNRRTVERAVADGHLATVTLGRARRVHPDDLADYLAAQRCHGKRPAGVAISTGCPPAEPPTQTHEGP